jgi:hypothetical protein
MAAYIATGRKGGTIALRDIMPGNIRGVYITVIVRGGKIVTAHPVIK